PARQCRGRYRPALSRPAAAAVASARLRAAGAPQSCGRGTSPAARILNSGPPLNLPRWRSILENCSCAAGTHHRQAVLPRLFVVAENPRDPAELGRPQPPSPDLAVNEIPANVVALANLVDGRRRPLALTSRTLTHVHCPHRSHAVSGGRRAIV